MATDRAEFIDKLRKVGFFEDPGFENAKTIDEVKLTVPGKVESKLDLGFLIEKSQINDEQTSTEATNGGETIEQITASQILEILDNFEAERIQPDTRMVKNEQEFASLADVELEIDDISNNLNENDVKSETTAHNSLPVQSNNTHDGSGEEPDVSPESTLSPTDNSVIQSTTTVILEQTIKASELLSTTPILKLENNDDRFYQDLGSLFGEGTYDILKFYNIYHGRDKLIFHFILFQCIA